MLRLRTLCLCLVTLVVISAMARASEVAPCDRSCLIHITDEYLAAMMKHDPTGLPLASNYKYTENAAKIDIGDGLWVGAADLSTTFKIYAADPESGQVGYLGIMKEFGKLAMFVLRLKVVNGQITEIEHVVARDAEAFGGFGPSGHRYLETARPEFSESVPSSERVSRQEMLRIANSYFESIEQSKGEVAPFADDCVRHENGFQTTKRETPDPLSDPAQNLINGLGCAAQINSGAVSYITRIRPRRLVLVDEEKGLVLTFPMFVHRGAIRSVKIVGVPGIQSQPTEIGPVNFFAGELFKIRGGMIHQVEAFGTIMPFGAANGWE